MGLTSLKLSAGVALLVGGFATQNALADSYVFVTNTTPQTVSLGTGSNTNCPIRNQACTAYQPLYRSKIWKNL